jgi:hypothetical protein
MLAMPTLDAELYIECLKHHRSVMSQPFTVKDIIPIPYFGDVNRYKDSQLKVLTAALNPSEVEFVTEHPRFNIDNALKGPAELEYELSNYFKENPYKRWFSSFEPVLNGLGASYGGKMDCGSLHEDIALHVDMCSPIATTPTWSRLTPTQRNVLNHQGRKIFERLIEELKPDIVIASVGWGHIQHWHEDFNNGHSWDVAKVYTTKYDGTDMIPVRVQYKRLTTDGGHKYLFTNGTAANTPFGKFHSTRKGEVGKVLKNYL